MTIKTKYDFGDKIAEHEGKVKGIHIYVSEDGIQTERYYLGDHSWLTIKAKTKASVSLIDGHIDEKAFWEDTH